MLQNLPYLNKEQIEFYYEQFFEEDFEVNKAKTTIELSLAGPKFSKTFEKDTKNFSTYKKLDLLFDALTLNNLISSERPNSYRDDDGKEFVYEKIKATKLFFPKSTLNEIDGLKHLVVWVSDPNPADLSTEQWRFTGTFLYLIETVYDLGRHNSALSGCSALQAIANIIKGDPTLKIDWNEPFGRNNNKHPIEKLQSLGAIPIGEREIETVYRKRYFSDEQCFIYKGTEFRCCDLLGYPLFIDAKY